MKKSLIFLIVLMLGIFVSCGKGSIQRFEKIAQVKISQGEVLQDVDTHGGFHGDGTRITVVDFSKKPLDLTEQEHWKNLPLSDTCTRLIYGDGKSGPYIAFFEEAEIPMVTEGYYFFYDRHSESKDPFEEEEIFNRHSFNFTLGIYDTHDDRLYIVEEDT